MELTEPAFTLTTDQLRELVRGCLREELGPKLSTFATESAIVDAEQVYKACAWDRARARPEWLTEVASRLCIEQILPHVLEHCGTHERVYFIQCGEGGPVKIGVSTSISQRLEDLQVANPVGLILRGAVPGSRMLESYYHKLFAAQRIRGEWFHSCDTMEIVMRTAAQVQQYS